MQIPETPAGRVLHTWLEAFNSGDRARIDAYHARHEPDASAAQTLTFRRKTGGFELLEIEGDDRLHLDLRVKEKASATTAIGQLDVDEGEQVVSFELRALPPGAGVSSLTVKIDDAARARVLDRIAAALRESYVYPEVAEKLVETLRAHRGEYDAIDNGAVLAARLTAHLRAVSGDKHLRVRCTPAATGPEAGAEIDLRAQLERENCGFEKAERLDGNLGYLKLNFFGPLEICAPTAAAAMNFLAHVDALIFDLRDNSGGDPKMVAWLSSYLFDERTHLNDLYERRLDQTSQYWTDPDVPGKKLSRQPIYVLTSRDTFSGAEEFAYNLQALRRAVVVGEVTRGGAHPTEGRPLDQHFVLGVPIARAINPITGTNWEGLGVQPDVQVAADQALEVAKQLATDEI